MKKKQLYILFKPLFQKKVVGGGVQFNSVPQSGLTLCNPMNRNMPGLPVHHQLPPKPMSIVLVMPSNHLILCHPLLVLPSIFPRIRVFSTRIPLLLAAHGVFHLPCSMQSLQLQHVLSSYLCVCMCAQSFQLFPTLCDPIDCSSLTRDQTWTPELVVWSLSHWTTRQFLVP